MNTSKGDRIIKSDSARKKRKSNKRIRENVLDNYYSKMRNHRKKLNKIKSRHHDNKV